MAALWAAPTRIDDDGRRAARDLLRRAGELAMANLGGSDAATVTAWAQGRVGVAGDGAWGPKSTAACGAWLRERGIDGDGRLDGRALAALQGLWP